MKPLILFAALILAGCAPKLTFSNEAGGVVDVTGTAGNDRIFSIATKHCAKSGKVPRMSARNIGSRTVPFECVAK